MPRILIAFATSEGQTEKIAHHLASQLEDRGNVVRLLDLKSGESEAGADDCEAAIIAGSMHVSRHDPQLSAFIMRHAGALRGMPTAFLSVSLTAASHEGSELRALDEVVRAFLHGVGWQPDLIEYAAGAVHDRELNAIERLLLHRILDVHGVERHPSGHTELTDWARLDRFAETFSDRAATAQNPSGRRAMQLKIQRVSDT